MSALSVEENRVLQLAENHQPAHINYTFAELYHIKLFSVHLNIKPKTTLYY